MIEFVSMDESDFQEYRAVAILDYADENVRAGNWDPDEAEEKASSSYDELLPDGVSTANNHISTIVDSESKLKVGMIWFVVKMRPSGGSAFLCDFRIDEAHRRKGYGRRTLLHFENELKKQGITRIALHVFGGNAPARSLYESLGYITTNIHMAKELNAGS
jgi:ribosomal protein S18 acetylase RimI-like enzyme